MSTDAPPSVSPTVAGRPAEGGAVAPSPLRVAPRRRKSSVRWAAIAVALVTIVLVAVLATRPQAGETVAPSPLVGQLAPAISGSTLTGGVASLSALRGRYVLVNFYASWCPPCRTETPQLVKFAFSRPAGQRVAVLGVVFADTPGNAAAFEHQVGATWPSVVDPSGKLAIAYGVNDPPQSFLVAPDGRVVARIVGGVTATGATGLESLVATAAAEHP